jgi:thioredoxin 2
MRYLLVFVLIGAGFYLLKPKSGSSAMAKWQQLQRVMDKTDDKVLVYFWQPHCAGCETMAPIVASVPKDYANISVFSVDTSLPENRAIHDAYQIRGTPTFVVVQKGQIVGRNEGPFRGRQDFLAFLRPSKVY